MIKLGEGTFGVVCMEEGSDGHTVAVKYNKPGEEGVSLSTLRECDVYMRLSHPYMPRVISIEYRNHILCIVMEKADSDVYSWLSNPLRTPTERLSMGVEVLWKTLNVLDFIHRHHTLHRDIKPENMLLYNGEVVLTDFGACNVDKKNLTPGMGTASYRAPEMNSRKYGRPSEIYCLGCSVIHVVSGMFPVVPSNTDVAARPTQWLDILLRIKWLIPRNMFNILKDMIEPLPNSRITVKASLKHALFSSELYRSVDGQYAGEIRSMGDWCARREVPYNWRRDVVTWLFITGVKFDLSPVICAHAVHAFDDFCYLDTYYTPLSLKLLYLIGIVCYMVVARFFGIHISLAAVYGLLCAEYTISDLFFAEEHIMTVLDFRLNRRNIPQGLFINGDSVQHSIAAVSHESYMIR